MLISDDQHRHACEIRWCVNSFYPDGTRMAAHLTRVETRRGKPAAERLRTDVREAWRAEMASAKEAS
jgi:hypothetical protein